MNKIIVIGKLGRDPEMRYTASGQSVTSFSVASNRRYTTASGESREETEWFNVSAWGKQGETCNQYLTKGQEVYVEGRLRSRSYQTREGETRFSNDITLTDFHFLSRPQGMGAGGDDGGYVGEAAGYGNFGSRGDMGPPTDDADDLPF